MTLRRDVEQATARLLVAGRRLQSRAAGGTSEQAEPSAAYRFTDSSLPPAQAETAHREHASSSS